MSSEESLKTPGDVIIEETFITLANGDNIDLKNFIVEFSLYEDIFAPCLTGNFLISDAANLISDGPILGNELITVKYRTPTLSDEPANVISKSFQIYSIENRVLNNDRESFYNIGVISREGFQNQFEALVKSYSGLTHEIVSDIYKTYIEKDRRVDVPGEPTRLLMSDTPHQSRIRYISNHWTPFENFLFIGKRSKGATLNGADYLFYESNKAYFFTSIEAMINLQKDVQFDEYVVEIQEGTIPRRSLGLSYSSQQFPGGMTRISAMKMPKTIDIIEGQKSGYHSNTIRGYDLTTKKMTESTFDFRTQSGGFVKTDAGIPIPNSLPKNPYSFTQFVTYATSLFDDYGITDSQDLPDGNPAQFITDRIHFRRSYLNSFKNYTFEIDIPGRTDIQVGHVINILYPSAKEKVENENTPDKIFDPLLSGPYIISAIKHVIKQGEHLITAEVIKNGLTKSLGEPT